MSRLNRAKFRSQARDALLCTPALTSSMRWSALVIVPSPLTHLLVQDHQCYTNYQRVESPSRETIEQSNNHPWHPLHKCLSPAALRCMHPYLE
ncbi:hypothetical protein BJY00DRAFT_10953 [Aspergillus carlsbadensis]|nr:hypothetical protein BJY00DRAFT_10953 [Aspergillus carlsbadensis]